MLQAKLSHKYLVTELQQRKGKFFRGILTEQQLWLTSQQDFLLWLASYWWPLYRDMTSTDAGVYL